jgi:S-adenosylmethionine:tRNA ribosyltransferase-isomerase
MLIAAAHAVQRPANARLLVIDAGGRLMHARRDRWLDCLRRGDVVIANDAATLPASLTGAHARTGRAVEARLAAWRSTPGDWPEFDAVIFGAGDFRMRTEDRPSPPPLAPGDRLQLGPLTAIVRHTIGHPRLARLRFDHAPAAFWRGLATHGRPVQYAHLREPLALRDAWTPIAAAPTAFEPPSAAFILDWRALAAMRAAGIGFATLTHAAGLSSTGDPQLDQRLPFDEPYHLPDSTVRAIADAHASRGRVIAIGTTVVRALEHAAQRDGDLRAGDGVATQRIGAGTRLRVVDGVVTGTHEAGSSHHELLRSFASDRVLARAGAALERAAYRTHEFGDSMLVFRAARTAVVLSAPRARGAPREDRDPATGTASATRPDIRRCPRACCCCA